jgi:hypothetical protein
MRVCLYVSLCVYVCLSLCICMSLSLSLCHRLLARYRSYRQHEICVRTGLMELATSLGSLDAVSALLAGPVRLHLSLSFSVCVCVCLCLSVCITEGKRGVESGTHRVSLCDRERQTSARALLDPRPHGRSSVYLSVCLCGDVG